MNIASVQALPAAWEARPAVIDGDGRLLTYAHLYELVTQEAAALRATGVPLEGQIVVTPGHPGLHGIVRALATWELGACVMPAHPRWSAPERVRILERARPAIDWCAKRPGVLLDAAPALARAPGSTPAVVMFTSGTTGRRKGVVLTHENLRAAAIASESTLGWRPNDRWALGIPLAHVGGLSVATRCLAAGACVVCVPRFEAKRYHAVAEQHGITLDSLVPTMLHRALRERERPPTSLRAVLVGGAAASPALIGRARNAGWPVRLTYGMTETAAQFCTQRAGDQRNDGAGPPLAGCEVDIRDGVLWVRGPSVASRTLPGSPPLRRDEGGWLCTGDAAEQRQDGSIVIRSRLTELIISGGENVYPQEVERVLAGGPGVDQVCVVAEPDDEWGHVVVAVVVLREGEAETDRDRALCEVETYARSALAPYARPKRYVIVPALPETAAGKLDRAAALQWAQRSDT